MTIDPVILTQALIRCESVTPEDDGALSVLKKNIEPLGFTCHDLPFSEEGHPTVHNLYARRGTKGKHLCFAGHTDVVPPGNKKNWTHPPFKGEIVDGILYGRGTVDMKGAIACFIAAASEYLYEQPAFGHSLSLLITGDEEGEAVNGTIKILYWLKEQQEEIDACIVGEPTNPDHIGDMIKIGRRGSVSFSLTVIGIQGHVAYPQLAANPAPYITDILHTLSHHKLDEGTAFFDPSNLEITNIDIPNTAGNVIPAKATATFNIRFNDQHNGESLIEWVANICSKVVRENEDISYELSSRISGESFLTEPGPLSDLMVNATETVTGKTPILSTTGGTSDARFIKDICPVVECGLINKTAHKVDEHVAVEDLYTLKAIYKEAITAFFA